MESKQNENWLNEIITELRKQQCATASKQLCWTLSELHKEDRISDTNKNNLISQIQNLLDKEEINAEQIVPKFNQHNCYLDISLKNGRHVRIMDTKPFGEPVASPLILQPEKDLGTITVYDNKLRVGIYPAHKTLASALSNKEISVEKAKTQINNLQRNFKNQDLVLWDPWVQNFGVNDSGQIFISFDGAVARIQDIKKQPFLPYTENTIEQLQAGGFKKLDTMLNEAANNKKFQDLIYTKTNTQPQPNFRQK